MHYRYIDNAHKLFATSVVHRGWRRFGKYFFYPICDGCSECKSLRIVVDEYIFTKSKRRIIKKNLNTEIVVQRPSLSDEHLKLYNKYHNWKAKKDGWRGKNITHNEYNENFVEGAHNFGKEVLYIIDGKLVGVDLIDIVDDGISSIYFYYDPDFSHLSLGTYSLLYQVALAKNLQLPYIYLGYWVDGCKAFAYKKNFEPLELLDGFPHITEMAEWKSSTES
jgi:arginine-tRNA-protein transferase